MGLNEVKIGGVPEHFNYPWHKALDQGKFEAKGVDLKWLDYPGGTGAMSEALINGDIDLALLLTEGAVSFISKGAPFKIVQTYVQSPLNWGIHVPFESDIHSVEEIRGKTFAISRYGSGSHLMAFVDANERNWQTNNLKFEVVGNLNGAIDSFTKEESQVFLWEKFTTQPYVDKKIFRRIGVRPTPWPCFVLVASDNLINQNPQVIQDISEVIFETSQEVKSKQVSVTAIAAMYGLRSEEVASWFEETEWATTTKVSESMLDKVSDTLLKLHLIEEKKSYSEICL